MALETCAWYLQELDPVGKVVTVGSDGPHDDIRVSVHVLGQRVVADVGTELQWTLNEIQNLWLKSGRDTIKSQFTPDLLHDQNNRIISKNTYQE